MIWISKPWPPNYISFLIRLLAWLMRKYSGLRNSARHLTGFLNSVVAKSGGFVPSYIQCCLVSTWEEVYGGLPQGSVMSCWVLTWIKMKTWLSNLWWHENERHGKMWDGRVKTFTKALDIRMMMAKSTVTGWCSKGINVRSNKPAD